MSQPGNSRGTTTGSGWPRCPYELEKPKGDLPKGHGCDDWVPPTKSKSYNLHRTIYHPNAIKWTTPATSGQTPSAAGRRSTSAPPRNSRSPAPAVATRQISDAKGKRKRSSSHSPNSPGSVTASAPIKRPRFTSPPAPWSPGAQAPGVGNAVTPESRLVASMRISPQLPSSRSETSLVIRSSVSGSKSPAQTTTTGGGGRQLRSGLVSGNADRGRSADSAQGSLSNAQGKMPVTGSASPSGSTEACDAQTKRASPHASARPSSTPPAAGTRRLSVSDTDKVQTRSKRLDKAPSAGAVASSTLTVAGILTVAGRLRKHVEDQQKGIMPKPYGLVGGIPWYIWTAHYLNYLETRPKNDTAVDEVIGALGSYLAGGIDDTFNRWRKPGRKIRNKKLHAIFTDLTSRYEQAESSAKATSRSYKQLNLQSIPPSYIENDGAVGGHSLLWILHCLTGPEAEAARRTYAAQMSIGPFPMDVMVKLCQIKPNDLLRYGKSNKARYFNVDYKFRARFEKRKENPDSWPEAGTLKQIYDDCLLLANAPNMDAVKTVQDLEKLREGEARKARTSSPRPCHTGSPSAS